MSLLFSSIPNLGIPILHTRGTTPVSASDLPLTTTIKPDATHYTSSPSAITSTLTSCDPPLITALTPPSIVLGHELVHAYRNARGIRQSGYIYSTIMLPGGNMQTVRESIEELETIGINESDARFTENALRQERSPQIYDRVSHFTPAWN